MTGHYYTHLSPPELLGLGNQVPQMPEAPALLLPAGQNHSHTQCTENPLLREAAFPILEEIAISSNPYKQIRKVKMKKKKKKHISQTKE